MCFNGFWKFSLFQRAQKSVFVANLWLISLEILASPQSNDLDRPELVVKPLSTDFTHQNRPLPVCFNDFCDFSLPVGAQKSLFLKLISLEILVFPKNNDLDRPEFVFKPY